MPSDSNGVYSLPSGYEATTGEIIQASQHNPPLEDLASAMSQRLMRSGVAPMTGPLKIADGSVGSPGLKFSSDGTSGFYKTANGIGVSVGGTKVAEFTSCGLSRMIGELIPWTLLSAPAGWVLPYGQTLSRTTYADLWTIAQTEIAGGNTFFTNGDGSTTFGIGDLRGRVVAGKDNIGGTAASRLTSTYLGTAATVVGATGGGESQTLLTTNLPPYTPTGTNGDITVFAGGQKIPVTGGIVTGSSYGSGAFTSAAASNGSWSSVTSLTGSGSTFFGVAQGGTSSPFSRVQPTMICNYILYAGA